MSIVWTISEVIPAAIMLSQVVFVLGLVSLFTSYRSEVLLFLRKHAFSLSFVVSFLAMIGSLFYSDIMLLEPCRLCWYQRILMYPQVVISLVGTKYPSKQGMISMLWLSIVGFAIATFHYITQFFTIATSCGVNDASCSTKLIFHFGYITIPLMALTGFLYIGSLMIIKLKEKK